MLSSNYAIGVGKKLRFIKEQEDSRFLTGLLRVKRPFEIIPIIGNIIQTYKTNEIVNNFLLVRDKFVPEINLRQPVFACSAHVRFTKKRKSKKEIKRTNNSRYIYQNELDKACF